MSRLSDIIRQVAKVDPQLAKDLQRETDALADRRAFGLNFERHTPEVVELPGRPVRKNDKVRILPERGEMPKKENQRLYRVTKMYKEDGERWANVEALDESDQGLSVLVDNLVVIAEFRDPIYPGLVSTGRVERGGDKPFHTVINAENFHALQALLFTHRGNVDAIYIDPPYNTGAKDWKYNNDYVESDDHYRHSKWLAMMERRLLLAKELLNPNDSVLVVTIDEKEYLRLGLLLEQTFSEARIQMVSSVIKPGGVSRKGYFGRSDEYLYFVMIGVATPGAATSVEGFGFRVAEESAAPKDPFYWNTLWRSGSNARREDRPDLFYPIYVNEAGKVVRAGDPLRLGIERSAVGSGAKGETVVWPIRQDGSEGRWQLGPGTLMERAQRGYIKCGRLVGEMTRLYHLSAGEIEKIHSGVISVTGNRVDGSVIGHPSAAPRAMVATSQWTVAAHDATRHGTILLSSLLPHRAFPFPKSLYAVEDTLRFFVANKPHATILDFFAGSGTTAHAVMRLNKQDGGSRRSISITDNEVSADEQKGLREEGLRPGDAEWEQWGICDYITKPRIKAAITGKTPEGKAISGDYKFTDAFSMADGFEENAELFTLTYESAMRVSSNREFARIAPFLWLRAGSRGRRIDDVSKGWDVADAYGVIANLDLSEIFVKAVESQSSLTHAFIVTEEDRLFEAMVRQLPEHVEPVRLYSSYLRNFEIESGRSTR
jgi:adenine-specific DNA-methyltransferase